MFINKANFTNRIILSKAILFLQFSGPREEKRKDREGAGKRKESQPFKSIQNCVMQVMAKQKQSNQEPHAAQRASV